MFSSKSNENPQKSIVCVVEHLEPEGSVDYYVSDEKKLSEVEEIYKERKQDYVEKSGKLRGAIKPISNSGEDMLYGNYIVFKSRLYRLGGYEEGGYSRKSVDYLDLKKMEKVWIPGPEMNHERYNPYPVILGGQLYVVSGLKDDATECKDPAVLMEVLKIDESGWEDIPNPPPYPSFVPSVWEEEEHWIRDNIHFRTLYSEALVGAVKSESKAFMIVGIQKYKEPQHRRHHHHRKDLYELFTYAVESEDEGEIRKWMPYTNINISSIGNLPAQPAVVFGQLILFIGDENGLLYVIDLKNDELHSFDISKMTPDLVCDDPILVMLEPGKFGLFWALFDTGVTALMCSIFTLKRNSSSSLSTYLLARKPRKPNPDLSIELTEKSHWLSLDQTPALPPDHEFFCKGYVYPYYRVHKLRCVLLVDHHILDPPNYATIFDRSGEYHSINNKKKEKKDYGLRNLVE